MNEILVSTRKLTRCNQSVNNAAMTGLDTARKGLTNVNSCMFWRHVPSTWKMGSATNYDVYRDILESVPSLREDTAKEMTVDIFI